MSEPDAVPLPREGEVFFDVRGEARSMRLSWYANSKVAVFSIWQGNRCTGTFRLPFADLTRMVQALQAGPPPAEVPGPLSGGSGYQDRDGYQDREYGQDHDYPVTASYGQPMPADPGFADTTAYYPGQEYGEPGYQEPQYQEPQYQEPQYQEPQHQEPQYREPQYRGQAYQESQYQEPQYQEPQYQEGEYQGGQYHQEAQYQEAQYQEAQYQEAEYGGWSEQAYGDSGADADAEQPYGDHPYGQHGYQDDYPADPGYGRVGRHSASHDDVPRSDSVPPSQRANYAMPDYDPPAHNQAADQQSYGYGDNYATGPQAQRTQPDFGRSQHAWSDSGWSEESARPDPLRSTDAESVSDPAMMSFPSVPARNGPAGYR
jgi:hypothetical protein